MSQNERLDKVARSMAGEGRGLTLREIARRNRLVVSPYLRGVMARLVSDGHVTRTELEGVYPLTHLYTLTESGEKLAELVNRLYEGE